MTSAAKAEASPDNTIDATWYREVMGHYPTGVVVVTGTANDGEPVGMVVGTFVSVSLDPPLVPFMPTRTPETFERLRTAPAYCVNVLAFDQVELCRIMGARGPAKFSSVAWSTHRRVLPGSKTRSRTSTVSRVAPWRRATTTSCCAR